jgi:hypothetical protein
LSDTVELTSLVEPLLQVAIVSLECFDPPLKSLQVSLELGVDAHDPPVSLEMR